jgi:hypothetical protein
MNVLTLEEGKYLRIIIDPPIRRADIIVRYAIIILSSITVFIDTKIRRTFDLIKWISHK